jgi:hypothetical protein
MTQPLWTPVDCACGKPADSRAGDSMPLQEINLLYLGEVVDGLVHGVDALTAEVESLRLQLIWLIGALDEPLPLQELARRLGQLREKTQRPGLPISEAGPDSQPDQEVTNQ